MTRQQRTTLITILVSVLLGALLALAGSTGGAQIAGLPLFALAVGAAFVIQVLVYIPSAIAQTERYFDLTGSATFIAVSFGIIAASAAPDVRSWVLTAMVVVWALRLGSFLFLRIRRAGADGRFDEIKTSKMRFLRVWIVQGLWVSMTAAAAWIALSIAPEDQEPLEGIAYLGIALWLIGFSIEVVADLQKSAFTADPRNKGTFIRTGLWSRSRHPNYFGEIMLWMGVALVAAPVLQGWQWIALLSPVFVLVLIVRVSGVPLLEAKADKRWGGEEAYETYKRETPVLWLRLTRPPQG